MYKISLFQKINILPTTQLSVNVLLGILKTNQINKKLNQTHSYFLESVPGVNFYAQEHIQINED